MPRPAAVAPLVGLRADQPPLAAKLRPADFERALSQLDASESAAFERELRLWCFWNRNHPRRGRGDAEVPPAADGNTARLLQLLLPHAEASVLVCAQALRDLGRFDEARALIDGLPEPDSAPLFGSDCRWPKLIELAERGRRDVVPLVWSKP